MENGQSKEEFLLEIEKLKKSVDFFKTIADYTYDWEMLLDPNGNFSYISPSCKTISGYAANEFLENPGLFQEIIHPDDKESVGNHFSKKKQNEKDDFHEEFRIITKSGSIKWIEHFCQQAFDSSGNFIGYRGSNRDITNRKETEIELHKTNRLLTEERYLFSQGNVVVFKWRNAENWPVEYVSTNVMQLFGYSPEEIESPQFLYSNFIYPADLARVTSEVEINSKQQNQFFKHEPYRVIGKSGAVHWVLDYKIILKKAESEIVNFIGYIVDITEHKHAVEALQEKETKYRELYTLMRLMSDTMPDMIWAKDLHNQYVFANKAMCNNLLSALDTSEPIGKTDLFFAQRQRELHPENKQWHTFGELCMNTDVVTLQEMKEMQFDEYGNVKGKFLFLDVHKAPLVDDKGKLIGVVGSARDITEHKKMEASIHQQLAFQNALNEISSVIISTNESNTILIETTNILGKTLQVDRCLIYEVDFNNHILTAFSEWLNPDFPEIIPTKGVYSIDIFKYGISEMYRTKEYQISHFDEINPALVMDGSDKILHGTMNIKSALWFPFSFHSNGYNLLVLNTNLNKRLWTNPEIDFLHSVSKQVTIALEKIHLLDKKKEADDLSIKQLHILRNVLDNSPIGIWMINEKGKMNFVNKTFCDSIGITEEKFIEVPHYQELYDKETAQNCIQSDKEALELNIPHTSFENVKFADGQFHHLEIIKNKIVDENGKPMGLIGISLDITERNLAEQNLRKLQTAIENSKACIVITDNEGNTEYANPYFSQLTGYLPHEYLGKSLGIIKTDLYHENFYDNLWKTLKSGNTWEGEFCNRKKSGEIYWENAIISPIKNNINEITHFVAVKTDITEAKKIKEELSNAKDKAEESDQLKTAFLNNISHEIRTPMNVIIGFSQFLIYEINDLDKRENYAQIVQKGCNQLLDIVTDVIQISEVQAEQLELTENYLNLQYVIDDINKHCQKEAFERNLQFILNIDLKENQFQTVTDKYKLSQIFKHLINNAFKFTQEGYIKIEGHFSAQNEYVFSISDTGIGIHEEMQLKIFEAFRQVEVGAARNFGGTGLGLCIAKAYIELLGGKIDLHSEVNKGTTVSFTIPYKPAEFIQNSAIKNTGPINLDDKTILIAEDEILNYMYIKELLNYSKAKILHANNGVEAIDFCRNMAKIDLILMDIKMPIMDGLSAAKLIKEFRPDLPIIAQTAYAMRQDIEKFNNPSFNDYITKPINKIELMQKIMRHLENKSPMGEF